MPADQDVASDSSSTVSNQQLNRYPNDWKCFHFKIQTWFYASLGTLCCFCTVRIADYILTVTYIQSASPESKSFNLSRFHGILSFDALQVLSIILLGAYGTYRMNSKLIGTYLMLQVSFLAVNGFLLVYKKFSIVWPHKTCDFLNQFFVWYKMFLSGLHIFQKSYKTFWIGSLIFGHPILTTKILQ